MSCVPFNGSIILTSYDDGLHRWYLDRGDISQLIGAWGSDEEGKFSKVSWSGLKELAAMNESHLVAVDLDTSSVQLLDMEREIVTTLNALLSKVTGI